MITHLYTSFPFAVWGSSGSVASTWKTLVPGGEFSGTEATSFPETGLMNEGTPSLEDTSPTVT